MKDLGEARSCLGVRIQRDRKMGVIAIDQQKYIDNLLSRFKMLDCNGAATPLDPNQNLFDKDLFPKTEEDKVEMEKVPYQKAIGSLLYAAQATRPDISYAVGLMSRFNHHHGRTHWTAVKRIMRYLSQTVHMKLVYKKSGDCRLIGYCDSDWAGDKQDYKSTTGYTFMLSGAAVSWNSKKQPTVAKSTTEAEYMALSVAAAEAIWLKGLLLELMPSAPDLVKIYCDNKGA